MVEHERDRAGLREVAAVLGEGRAHLAGGAVAVVGQHLDDHRDAARAVALVADLVVVLGVAAQRLLDRALDGVLGHVLGARRDHRRPQPRVHRRVGHAELRRHRDFARELAEQLGPDFVLPPLAVHDVLELGMTGHGRRLSCILLQRGGLIGRCRAKIQNARQGRGREREPPLRQRRSGGSGKPGYSRSIIVLKACGFGLAPRAGSGFGSVVTKGGGVPGSSYM